MGSSGCCGGMTATTHSAAETRALGESLARTLKPGDVILLSGGLGAGKSEFTRGIARGLGVGGLVPSPTFTLLNVYEEGRIPLYHFDWYRIADERELLEMGIWEYLSGDGAAVIEWHERAPGLVPDTALEIIMTAIDENTREITYCPRGNWEARHTC